MESRNGQAWSPLSETVDYSGVLHNGVPRDILESTLGAHDRARHQEVESLQRQVAELSAALDSPNPELSRGEYGTDIRSEIAQLRQDFASATASIHALLANGDGDLPQMQLTSLRRQVTQLEGVLESNYQRELHIAEEREAALRAELAQMRQDLRVALETLYRMPAEPPAPSAFDEMKGLETQVTELGASIAGLVSEQQRAAVERENTLKAEIAHMRRDLLVTLEASFELPSDRLQGLDAQMTSWRGQVEALQSDILRMQESQQASNARQASRLEAQVQELDHRIQGALGVGLPEADRQEMREQRLRIDQLAQRLEDQAASTDRQFERLSQLVSDASSTLDLQLAAARDQMHRAVETMMAARDDAGEASFLVAVDSMQQRIAELQTYMTLRDERDGESRTESAALLAEVTAAVQELTQRLETRLEIMPSEALTSLRDEVRGWFESFAAKQRELQEGNERALLDGLDDRLQAVMSAMEVRHEETNTRRDELALDTAETLRTLHHEMTAMKAAVASTQDGVPDISSGVRELHDTIGALQANVLGVQEELRIRSTGLDQAVGDELRAARDALLDATLVMRDAAALDASPSMDAIGDTLTRTVHGELAVAREAQTEQYRQVISQVANVQSDLDDLRVSMQGLQPLESGGFDSDTLLRDQLQVLLDSMTARDGETPVPSTEYLDGLRAEMEALRNRLEALPRREPNVNGPAVTHAAEYSLADIARTMSEQLQTAITETERHAIERDEAFRREWTAAVEALRAGVAPEPAPVPDSVSALPDRVAQLEAALKRGHEEQRRWLDERDAALYDRLGELRSSFMAFTAGRRGDEGDPPDERWKDEFSQLHREIAAVAQSPDTSNNREDSTVMGALSALRLELMESLAELQATRTEDPALRTSASEPPEAWAALAETLQRSKEHQGQLAEAQQRRLEAALGEMRDELRAALSGLTRESVDTFEQRQNQLRLEQLEMERKLAQLRQELLATQADPANKKKLWR